MNSRVNILETTLGGQTFHEAWKQYQNEIEKLLKEKLNSTIVEGFEPTDTAPPKRAATQSKGSFGKKKSGAGGNRPKNKPHFKGNKNTPTSGRGRTGAPKRKRT